MLENLSNNQKQQYKIRFWTGVFGFVLLIFVVMMFIFLVWRREKSEDIDEEALQDVIFDVDNDVLGDILDVESIQPTNKVHILPADALSISMSSISEEHVEQPLLGGYMVFYNPQFLDKMNAINNSILDQDEHEDLQ